ncbi:Uncharacterized protein At5g65660 [Linum grandiflorum]
MISSSHMEEDDRPIIGFPLGFALLLLTLISMTAVFVCCLHWDRLRSFWDATDHHHQIQHKSSPPQPKMRKMMGESLPVLMPGDELPRFVAMACPVVGEKRIQVKVQKPPITLFPVPPLF